jgi:hypothetical protein
MEKNKSNSMMKKEQVFKDGGMVKAKGYYKGGLVKVKGKNC